MIKLNRKTLSLFVAGLRPENKNNSGYPVVLWTAGLWLVALFLTGFSFSDQLDLRLSGVMISGDRSLAFIEDVATGGQGTYRLGERIQGHEITKIMKDSIVLTKNNRDITLFFEGTNHWDLEGKAHEAPFELSAVGLAHLLENFSSNKNQIILYQHHESGKPAGLRIRYLTDENDFQMMGIENGDIIRKINGLGINEVSDILGIVHQLSDTKVFEIEVKRNSQKKILNYRLDKRLEYLLPIVSSFDKRSIESALY